MVEKGEIEIIRTKRVNRNGRYYDRVTYRTKEGESKTVYSLWSSKNTQEQRLRINKQKAVYRENELKNEYQIRKKKRQIAPKRKTKKKGFYMTSIRGHIVVRYKNTTPFFFPQTGETTSHVRAVNESEKGMLKTLLLPEEYEQFKHWYDRSKKNKNIYIFGGWTYKRAFSATGSFDGDSRYLDWVERRFLGNNGMETIDRYRQYRDNQPEKRLTI